MTFANLRGSGIDQTPASVGARSRATATVVALVFAYIGFLLGAPAPDFRIGSAQAGVQGAQGWQHLAGREGPRAVATVDRPDPRVPSPPSPPALGPARAAGLPTVDRSGEVVVRRPTTPRAVSLSRAHPPRAPPTVPA
ncbi:hypothetical protein [Chthonobacter albigriseus]|uniref:hypothetical protein n=1 Tax=Chthonobacter albigriseus TaxID=1683161 RepID=UPI0015EE5C26|nr:hypothetical protein [Chthonobacter albigriseus]